jgi:hypothetical protein
MMPLTKLAMARPLVGSGTIPPGETGVFGAFCHIEASLLW